MQIKVNQHNLQTLSASCPTATCGPLLDLNANRMICLLAKMNSRMTVSTPHAMKMTTVTPDSCSTIFVDTQSAHLFLF